jgi:hypothetical protein
MKKQILLITLLGIFLFSLVSATIPHKQNTDLEFSITSNFADECILTTINTPNGLIVINQNGTRDGQTFNFTISRGNYSKLGNHCHNIVCTDGTETTSGQECRDISYLGKSLSDGRAMLYIAFLGMLVFIFFLNFIAMGMLPKGNSVDEEGRIFSINYLKYFRNVLWMSGYFLFIAIVFITSNVAFAFLEEELLAQIFFMIYQVSFALAPVVVIVWLIWVFVSLYHDKQFQNLLNRGMFPQGNI